MPPKPVRREIIYLDILKKAILALKRMTSMVAHACHRKKLSKDRKFMDLFMLFLIFYNFLFYFNDFFFHLCFIIYIYIIFIFIFFISIFFILF